MSETEVIQQQEEKKKKVLARKKLEEIKRRKKKVLARKKLRKLMSSIDFKALQLQLTEQTYYAFYLGIKKELRTHERKKLIFNLLVKAWYSSIKRGVKGKFALTSKAVELSERIDIILINKYHFIIKGLDNMNSTWANHFKYILMNQYNRTVSQTKRNRFILEKEFFD